MSTRTKQELYTDMNVLRSYLSTCEFDKWLKSSAIYEWTGLTAITIRQVCQAYPAMFIAGVHGYKLTSYATPAEIQTCVAALLSRSDKMVQRASALSRRLVS